MQDKQQMHHKQRYQGAGDNIMSQTANIAATSEEQANNMYFDDLLELLVNKGGNGQFNSC